MKNTLIVILVLAVLVFGYFALKPKAIVAPTVSDTQTPWPPTQTSDTTQSTPPSSNQTAVAGMQQYTDASFGFSFWYPTNWKVSTTNNNPAFGASIINAAILKRVWLTKAGDTSPSIVIQEAHSTTRTITDTGGAGPIGPITYYFDPNKHLWMTSNSENAQTSSLTPANISNNTMGGLHIFSGTSRFNTSIIPLSADNFVVVGDNGGSMITGALTKTILALDPSVATPVSAAQQTQTIQTEASQNGSSSSQSNQTSTNWKTYTNTQAGFSIQYPSTFNTSSQNAATADFDGINSNNMFLANYPSSYFGTEDKDTNLAAVTVFAGTKNVNEDVCYNTLYDNRIPNETTTSSSNVIIDGITYHLVNSSEGAAGSTYTTYRYSTIHNGKCYQIYTVARSENNVMGASQYDPQTTIFPTLTQMLNTFKFL